jgi:hypothetical protein
MTMTTNAFIFSWDELGIDSIVPITQYENWDKVQMLTSRNRINEIIRGLMLRARYNGQRHYEIYAIDCDAELDEEFWRRRWIEDPQLCADIVRERGIKMYSARAESAGVKIV